MAGNRGLIRVAPSYLAGCVAAELEVDSLADKLTLECIETTASRIRTEIARLRYGPEPIPAPARG